MEEGGGDVEGGMNEEILSSVILSFFWLSFVSFFSFSNLQCGG